MSPVHAQILVETGPADDPHVELRSVVDRWLPEIERVTADLDGDRAVVTILPRLDATTVHPSQPHLVTISRAGGNDLRVTALDSFGTRTVLLYDQGSVGQALGFARVWLDADLRMALPIAGFTEDVARAC